MLPNITITPLGGVEDENNANSTITGSCTLVEVEYLDKDNSKKTKKILIDVGMIQGIEEEESIYLNHKLHISKKKLLASEIDDIFITHAHGDHLLLAPLYTKEGFTDNFHTHHHTLHIAKIMFEDAIKIQKMTLNNQSKLKKISYNSPALKDLRKNLRRLAKSGFDIEHIEEELQDIFDEKSDAYIRKDLAEEISIYNENDAINTILKTKTYPYTKGEWNKLTNGGEIEFKFYNAAHIKGSATIVFKIKNYNDFETRIIGFSGDLGRSNPVIKLEGNPVVPTEIFDFFMIESTYGNQKHKETKEGLANFFSEISKAINSGGKILIPTFALHRLAQLIELLYNARDKKYLIPAQTKIYCDTPLGQKILDYYIRNNLREYKHLFKAKFIDYTNRDKILKEKGIIILSTNGMMDGGPIYNYFELLEDSGNLLLACNYMDENTIGHQITVKKDKIIEYKEQNSDEVKKLILKAKVVKIGVFSGHADQKDLKEYVKSLKFKKDSTILINHGVLQGSMLALKNELERKGIARNSKIVLASINEAVVL